MTYRLLFCLLAFVVACSNATPQIQDAQILDTNLADGTRMDAIMDASNDLSLRDTTVRDATVRDVAVSDANGFGFAVRMPGEVLLTGSQGTITYFDFDIGCTLRAGGNNAIIYLQATPTRLSESGIFPLPVYEEVRAWLHDRNTMVTREIPASYDFGGGHNNDSFDITVGSQRFRYFHSSFGFGFRQCQPMDCVQIRNANGDLLEDGCTEARTLPEICAKITSTNFPPLTTDTFVACPH